MSTKYPGGFITKSPVAPTSSAASGIWTLDQQQQAQKAGTWPSPPIFIEDLFSTYLYTGTGVALNIVNNIDLSGQGGLVWIKQRSGTGSHGLIDTARGRASILYSNTSGAATTDSSSTEDLTSFNSNGFSLGSQFNFTCNSLGQTFASWTFREQPKFFDVVTYTGTGVARTVAHNLGSVPGCMIVKKTSASADWQVYHQSTAGGMGPSKYMVLNSTAAESSGSDRWNNTAPTSTVFTVGNAPETNDSGATYVAYLFAHDAGGFPVSGGGSTNGISCGSFTTDGSGNATVSLGYEPQWLLIKSVTFGGWWITDTMRGMSVASGDNVKALFANTSGAEANANEARPNATGFTVGPSGNLASSDTFIYVAIRRGPMKPPTVGTSVFSPVAYTGTSNLSTTTTNTLTNGFAADAAFYKARNDSGPNWGLVDKLRGPSKYLETNVTSAESTQTSSQNILFNNTQAILTGYASADFNFNYSVNTFIEYAFQRAPGFFDEVCYTGNGSGSGQVITHNLGVTPELIIIKARSGAYQWHVYAASLGQSKALFLETTGAEQANTAFTGGTINSSQFQLTVDFANVNGSGVTYASYLFATCPGVSKVGSYTGTGATQTIACGFSGGARFVLIKRTDSTGSWFVWDTARGMVSGTDPRLLLNATNADANADWVFTTTGGFQVVTTDANVNASGGTYIFLAIA